MPGFNNLKYKPMKTKEKIEDKIIIINRAIKNLELNNVRLKSSIIETQIFYYKKEVKLLEWVLT